MGGRQVIGVVALAAAVAVAGATSKPAAARMTVIYDVGESVNLLLGTQPDGSPGLVPEDGLFQQQPAPVLLPATRQVGKVSGGVGSALTPNIKGMSVGEMAALFRQRVDGAGARLLFVDELGQGPAFAGVDGANLDAAMMELAATPYPGGGTYADRVHMYVNPALLIADPAAWSSLWHAMSLTGGVWFEGYQGRTQWSPEHWLAWPRVLRDGLRARGMDPERLHVIVRGVAQDAIWAHMRTGVACEFLANGPGAYRTEDQAGFVREFRATFGRTPAPAGASAIACRPTPLLPEGRARQLADLLELERFGVAVPSPGVSPQRLSVGVPTTVSVELGTDPLGLAGRIGADPAVFWAAARGSITAAGPGIDLTMPIGADGSAALPLVPAAAGPVSLRVTLDGQAVRAALGPPADLAASLAPFRGRVSAELDRLIANPTTWNVSVPLSAELNAVIAQPATTPLRVTARVLRRRTPPRVSLVEFRLNRPATRLLVEVGAVRSAGYVRLRRLRITGSRTVVRVKIPRRAPIKARIVLERRTRVASPD